MNSVSLLLPELAKRVFLQCLSRSAAASTNMFGVIQLASTNEKLKNLNTVVQLINQAAESGAKMVFLPEAADFIGSSREESFELAESFDGPFFTTISKLSKQLKIWVSIGSMHRKPASQSEDQRLLNTHIVLNDEGEIVGMYDKTHLFSIDLNRITSSSRDEPKRLSLQESLYMQPGQNAPVVVHGTPVGDLGLAICYDLRFPELATALRYRGKANVLAYPSAFTLATGSAGHWHTLLRARAIENQCYVIAAAQSAVHNPKFTSYGHSMVIDPMGRIIAEQTENGPGLFLAQIFHQRSVDGTGENDTNYTERVRTVIPVEVSRRHDLFPLPDAGMAVPIGIDSFRFGPFTLKKEQIFYRSNVSVASVNISPLVPGHILVIPIEVIDRFPALPNGTITDMYACVKRIGKKLCEHYGARSLTIAMQDGVDAGQTVPHVHIHVLPRKPGDFAKNDDIYDALENHDKFANRKYRSDEEMAEEARLFRSFFYDDRGYPLNPTD